MISVLNRIIAASLTIGFCLLFPLVFGLLATGLMMTIIQDCEPKTHDENGGR